MFVVKEVRPSQIVVLDGDRNQTYAIGTPSGLEVTDVQIQGDQLVATSTDGHVHTHDLSQYPSGSWRPLGY